MDVIAAKGNRARLKEFVDLLIEAGKKWSQDNVPRLSAAVSFYAALSLAPFLILATVVAVFTLNRSPETRTALIGQARETFGPQAGLMLEQIIRNAQIGKSASFIASIASFTVMFFSASNLFLQIDVSVRQIWNAPQKGSIIRLFIQSRLTAFASVIVLGASLIGWLFLDSRLAYLAREATNTTFSRFVSFGTTILVSSAVCLISMKRLAGVKLLWSDVWPGALGAAFAISGAKYLLSLYFANSAIGNVYGPAGALVVILLWIYYCAQIYFYGTELVFVYAHRYGSLVDAITD